MHRCTLVLSGFLLALTPFLPVPSPAQSTSGPKGAGPEPELLVATYSIVACDLQAKEWGVGVSSRVRSVGTVVPWAKANVGAVATQAQTNISYGPSGLALLAKGKTAEEVVQELTMADKNAAVRQLGVVDGKGQAFAFTGKNCGAFAGHKTGKNF